MPASAKFEPSNPCQSVVQREREHSQASESDNSGEGAKDLVSIVEFQVIVSLRECPVLS